MKVRLEHMAEIDRLAAQMRRDGENMIDRMNADSGRQAATGDGRSINAASLMISAILRNLAHSIGPGAAVAAIGQAYGTMLAQTPPETRLAMTQSFASHMRVSGERVEVEAEELARMIGDTAGRA